MISILDFLYIVIAVGLIPTFTLLCLILWRIYKNMDRFDRIMTATEQVIDFTKNINQVPALIANKVISGFNSFFK